MHEVSLIESVVALVEDERRKQDFSRVRTIRLRSERLVMRNLRHCVSVSTPSRGDDRGWAGWKSNRSGPGWCGSCRQSVSLSERFAACPVCGGTQVKMTDAARSDYPNWR